MRNQSSAPGAWCRLLMQKWWCGTTGGAGAHAAGRRATRRRHGGRLRAHRRWGRLCRCTEQSKGIEEQSKVLEWFQHGWQLREHKAKRHHAYRKQLCCCDWMAVHVMSQGQEGQAPASIFVPPDSHVSLQGQRRCRHRRRCTSSLPRRATGCPITECPSLMAPPPRCRSHLTSCFGRRCESGHSHGTGSRTSEGQTCVPVIIVLLTRSPAVHILLQVNLRI